jgi:multidrug resistance efflux pump
MSRLGLVVWVVGTAEVGDEFAAGEEQSKGLSGGGSVARAQGTPEVLCVESSIPAPPVSVDELPTDGVAKPPPPGRKLRRSTRIALVVILIVAVIAGVGFAISYFLNARNYVSTDNAQVDGDKIVINAPTSGTIDDWRATLGTVLQRDEIIGHIKIQQGFAQPRMSIHAPANGTVAMDNVVVGMYVTGGTQLAIAYDLAKIYVTARVDETDIKEVHVGQLVDISVDAYPQARITGRVLEIQPGAAAVFSLFPQSTSQGTGNFQKVTQVIPVKIGFEDVSALNNFDLVPGMNVTVHIHKH